MPSKFDRCVKAVRRAGTAYNPYAVCNAALKHGAREAKRFTPKPSVLPWLLGGAAVVTVAGVAVIAMAKPTVKPPILPPATTPSAPGTPATPGTPGAPATPMTPTTPPPLPPAIPGNTTSFPALASVLTTTVGDPSLISAATAALAAFAAIPTANNPVKAGSTFQQQVQQFQSAFPSQLNQTGTLDYATAASIFATTSVGLVMQPNSATPQGTAITNQFMIAMAEQALVTVGSQLGLTTPYAGPFDGANVGDPAFVAAINTVRAFVNQKVTSAGGSANPLPSAGVLDSSTWGYILATFVGV